MANTREKNIIIVVINFLNYFNERKTKKFVMFIATYVIALLITINSIIRIINYDLCSYV